MPLDRCSIEPLRLLSSMNCEKRLSISDRLLDLSVIGACVLLLSGLVGCDFTKKPNPEPAAKSKASGPPPLPVAKSQNIVVAHSDNRDAWSMAAVASTNLPVPNLTVSYDSLPKVPESSPPPPRGTVTLLWDGSPDPSVVGYRVLYGNVVSGIYTHSATITNGVGLTNVFSVRLNGLDEGVTYYAAAIAYDPEGVESVPSNEVQFTTKHFVNLRQYSWAIEAFGTYSKTNEIQVSTNMVDWQTGIVFVGDGTLHQFIYRHDAQAWFRVITK